MFRKKVEPVIEKKKIKEPVIFELSDDGLLVIHFHPSSHETNGGFKYSLSVCKDGEWEVRSRRYSIDDIVRAFHYRHWKNNPQEKPEDDTHSD